MTEDDAGDYLNWYKREMRRWKALGCIDLAGSAVSGGEARVDLYLARGLAAPPADHQLGHELLREELARFLSISVGPDGRAPKDCILTAAGASNAIAIALSGIRRLFVRAGMAPHAMVEAPVYGPLFSVADYLGFSTSSFRRDVPDDLSNLDRPAVLVLSNPHNPTSAEWSAADIQSLLDRAPAGSYALVDETFINAGAKRESVTRLADPRIVAVGSLSKDPGISALRCGWVVAFNDDAIRTRDEMQRAWVHTFNIGSPITESAACEVIRDLPAIDADAHQRLRENREEASSALAALRSKGLIEWDPPAGGCVIFPKLTEIESLPTFDERQSAIRGFYERALERGVAVVPGDQFNPACLPHAGEANVRIGLGGPHAELREGLARLTKLIGEFSAA